MWQSIYAADLELMKPLTKTCRCLLLALVILVVQSASVVSACSSMASAPHSRWQVTAHNGVFWLLTPCGERFFSIGVNVLNAGYPQRLFQGFNQLKMRHWFERACGRRRLDQRELLARDQIRIDMRKQLSMLHFILLMLGDSELFRYRIGRKEDTYEALARNKQKGARQELTFGTIQ